MTSSNVCLECRKTYDKVPKRCMCGWYFVKPEIVSNDSRLCQDFTNGKQCKEVGSVSFKGIGEGWFCSGHAHMLREKSFK